MKKWIQKMAIFTTLGLSTVAGPVAVAEAPVEPKKEVTMTTSSADYSRWQTDYRRNHRRRVVCGARNYWGDEYYVRGTNPRRVQRLAVEDCEWYSNDYCRPIGCWRD